jgi:hypothetical protein
MQAGNGEEDAWVSLRYSPLYISYWEMYIVENIPLYTQDINLSTNRYS